MEFLRREYGVSKLSDLPSQTMLTVLSVFFYYKNRPTNIQLEELKRWFWRSSLSSRYIGSGYNENIGADSSAMVDLAIRGNKLNLPKRIPSFSEFEKVDLNTGRSTLRNSVKQLLWLQEPIWINGNKVKREDVETGTKQKEDDHFYPHNWMKKGYVGAEINNILNIHFIPKDENVIKSDKIPSEWLAQRVGEQNASATIVEKYCKCNLLPFENVQDLKRFDKKFIRKNGRIFPDKFRHRYRQFLWNRYQIFIKEFSKLQN